MVLVGDPALTGVDEMDTSDGGARVAILLAALGLAIGVTCA
jgi:hypothetical protein